MNKIHWTLLGSICGAGVLVFALYPDDKSQAGISATKIGAPFTGMTAPRPDGAADYQAKLAIAASKIDEQNPLLSYKPGAGIAGRIALEEMYGKGIPATPQSARLALGLLREGKLTTQEKIAISAILYGLHNRENTTGANLEIALELKNLVANPDRQVAANAVTYYAGLEYQPDTEYVLKDALKRGVLDSDSYFCELAHLVTSAPPDKQKEFLAEIRTSSNLVASDILAAALNSGQDYNAAPFLKSSDDMAKLLRDTEPQFGNTVGLYGGVDALRYAEWVRASAAIESQQTGRSADDIIVAKLSEPGTDPRKVMAYLSTPDATPLLADAAPNSQVQKLAAIARLQSNQNPSNTFMAQLADQIEARMTNPPPATTKPMFGPPTGPVMPPTRTPQAPQSMPR